MLRLADYDDPLIGRPLALYDTISDDNGDPQAVDVVYLVEGKMTSRLANCRAGTALDVWGPLGNGFSQGPVDHLVMVAGGIGHTPLLALAKEHLGQKRYGIKRANVSAHQKKLAKRVTLCYGAKTKSLFSGVEDFEAAGVKMRLSTDDGSVGRRGLVTEVLEDCLQDKFKSVHVACCGPEPMMKAVAKIAMLRKVSCEVSLETPMACGIGICFSCVTQVQQEDGDWDYQRTCIDGPVFPAEKIHWELK